MGAVLLLTGCALIEPEASIERPSESECDETPPRIDMDRFPRDTSLLWGEWRWVKTAFFFTVSGRPLVRTPCSAGYTETLIIRPEGIVEVYRNDTLAYRETLREFLDTPLLWGVNRDSLILNSVPVDGPITIYMRK
ncbi:hypothetical protein [Rhodothermus marinus]|uniref:hypothetical protein n=1 Tax=Rhodothermus marinus TaxID=29549 RepID=UPI001FB3113C|nr:hypothetical protein [Rhodothermus marinus]